MGEKQHGKEKHRKGQADTDFLQCKKNFLSTQNMQGTGGYLAGGCKSEQEGSMRQKKQLQLICTRLDSSESSNLMQTVQGDHVLVQNST